MDVQEEVVGRFEEGELLNRIARAIAAARGAGVLVIYVTVQFRAGYPEISRRNRSFGRVVEGDAFTGEAGRIPAEIGPQAGDVHVLKKRVSAFTGSDLEVILRSQGIDSLVLCGIATSGVVLSTLRQAADLDYELTVLEDCCVDGDAEVHRVLCEKVFPRQAEVIDAARWEDRRGG
jgi:nicotinamidase-related amidase